MEFTAKARFTRVSPQKARLVLDLIKGRRVEDALTTLTFTKKRIAPAIFQLLRSAVENANYLSQEKGMDVDLDRLYVKHAIANEGPRMKRIRPAPMGRAFRYQRRISHMERRGEQTEGGHRGGRRRCCCTGQSPGQEKGCGSQEEVGWQEEDGSREVTKF
jgi:ribosomal protein L22